MHVLGELMARVFWVALHAYHRRVHEFEPDSWPNVYEAYLCIQTAYIDGNIENSGAGQW